MSCWIYFRKYENIFLFAIIFQLWGSLLGRWKTCILHSEYHSDWCPGDARIRSSFSSHGIYTLRLRQNRCHFADDIFKCIFLNEKVWTLIKIPLKFVPKGPINKNPALVQIMAWCRSGSKPLSEPMVVSLLMHICVPRSPRVNLYYFRMLQFQHQKRWQLRHHRRDGSICIWMMPYGVTRHQRVKGYHQWGPANERRHYKVMTSLIGWAQT